MPELPEVEAARSLAGKHCKGLKILKAVVADDDKVIEGIAPRDLEAALAGRTIVAACRKGKQLWLDLGPDSPALMLHFGMTGCLVVKGVDAAKYVNAKAIDPEIWPPKYCKIELELSEGKRLAFCDSRRFARARFQEDPLNSPPVSLLGADILNDRPSVEDLAALLGRRKSAIKSVVMDQAVLAGVGNWVADEVLHEAGIHPSQLASDLSKDQLAALQRALLSVAQTAVAVNADDSCYPSHWLFAHRWKPKTAPSRLRFVTIGGRTTCFEPAKQKLTSTPAPESEPVDEGGETGKAPAKKRKAPAKNKRAKAGRVDGEEGKEATQEKTVAAKKKMTKAAAASKKPANTKKAAAKQKPAAGGNAEKAAGDTHGGSSEGSGKRAAGNSTAAAKPANKRQKATGR